MNTLLASVIVLLGATLWNGESEPQRNTTIIVRDDRIAAIGRDLAIPRGARVIDVEGAIVTAGLIDPASQLGLIELTTGEPTAIEGTLGLGGDEPIRAALKASDTFDPTALAIEVARQQGITSSAILPFGSVVAGQAAWISLRDDAQPRRSSIALVVDLRAHGGKPGSRSRAFLRLREALEDARLYGAPGNSGAYIRRNLRELAPSAQALDALSRALEAEIKTLVVVDRASDISTALQIVRDHKLDAVLLGAREGWRVAREIAASGVPVILDPLANLPEGFDTLESRADNALLLHRAGVRVAFTTGGPPDHAGRLRLIAGNAVAEGFPRQAALAAITRLPAEIFGVKDEGRLRVGARADLVVWNGDPFEPLSWAQRMLIAGREIDLRTRQDMLTERYKERSGSSDTAR